MRRSKTAMLVMLLTFAVTACDIAGNAPVEKDPYAIQFARPGKPKCIKTKNEVNEFAARVLNRPREVVGLHPVTPHPKLAVAAQKHACDMAARGVLSYVGSRSNSPHERVKKRKYDARIVAENITAGPYNLERVLDKWNSNSRYLNIGLTPSARHFGIGHAIAADGETHFWTAVYAAPN